jgi:hypothetical protein
MPTSLLLLFTEWFSHTETFYNCLHLVPNDLETKQGERVEQEEKRGTPTLPVARV